ncbi:MAG: aspartyl protease family protein [Polaromonas sp.]|uniref:aspartyl protease family protein n=1 Tax=Polaromonas sp. TaxID=1869339 RepID=UPI003263E119
MPQVARIERGVLQAGLFVDVYIGVSDALLKQLWKRNQPVPPAVFATFIVDTGADRTLVDEQIARTLGLIAVNQKPVITSESKGIPQICDIYAISIEVRNGGSPPWRMSTVAATGRPLMDDARHGVLGRDVLDRVKLVYDGPRQTFTIDYFY